MTDRGMQGGRTQASWSDFPGRLLLVNDEARRSRLTSLAVGHFLILAFYDLRGTLGTLTDLPLLAFELVLLVPQGPVEIEDTLTKGGATRVDAHFGTSLSRLRAAGLTGILDGHWHCECYPPPALPQHNKLRRYVTLLSPI